MIVAFACVRTSIMYKCSKFGISARNARNDKSQQPWKSKVVLNCVSWILLSNVSNQAMMSYDEVISVLYKKL